MTKYEILNAGIQKKYNNGEITFERAVELDDIAYEKYGVVEEGFKDLAKKGIEKAKEVGPKYLEGLDKRGEALGHAVASIVHGKDKKLEDEYKSKVAKIKNAYKVGEILTIEAISLVVPCTTGPYTAMLATGFANSTNPDDAKIKHKIDTAVSKIKGCGQKLIGLVKKDKGKPVTIEMKNQIDKVYLDGLNAAKEGDRVIASADNKAKPNDKAKSVNESVESDSDVMDVLMNDLLISECDNAIAIESFIENFNYSESTYEFVDGIISSFIK